MNRDNLLFLVIGVLTGFISGYLLQDVMSARQPPRLVANSTTGVAGGVAAPGGSMPAAPNPNQGLPPMEEILRLREYVAANPEDADSVLLLANLNYDIKSWEKAGQLYEQYLALRPESPDILTDLGVTFRERGLFNQALETFQRAENLSDSHWQSLYNQVVVLAFDQKNFAEAREVLARLRTLQPDNPEIDRLAQEVERQAGETT
ncbi:MAG: tetratricopeptide repeat protein [Thermoanaerobaculia bacterium]|nr:tetratricopeptide repeat protein [Thermoanaerobaculia bacterium]